MGKIVVVGSINMDVVTRTDKMPKPGETVLGDSLHFILGGKGSNQAIAASRLNGNVEFIGRVGEDDFGRSIYEVLKKEKMKVDGIRFTKGTPTGTAIICVDKDSQNSIVVVLGSNAKVSADDVSSIKLGSSDILLSQFEIPQETILSLFKRAKIAGAKTILNPAPAAKCSKELLILADYLIVNEHEVAFFANKTVTEDIETIKNYANKVKARKDQTIIVTLGAKGALCINQHGEVRVEGIKVNAIDTTAAGDCFAGAFAVALSEQKSLNDALSFANKAAALSVQRLGASSSLPVRSEVDTYMQR